MKVKLSLSHSHPEDLDSGRQLVPGEVTDIRKEEFEGDKAKALIDAETLFVIQERQSRKKED